MGEFGPDTGAVGNDASSSFGGAAGFDQPGSLGGGGFSGAAGFDQAGGFSGHTTGAWMHEHAHQQAMSMHQQHQLLHAQAMRRRAAGPMTPVGMVVGALIAIIALVVFASVASQMSDGMPGYPPSVVLDGPDDEFVVPPAPAP